MKARRRLPLAYQLINRMSELAPVTQMRGSTLPLKEASGNHRGNVNAMYGPEIT